MNLEGARRVMETTSYETANHYLRFGWSLINQHVVEATADQPAMFKYVLASVRRLEDTRRVIDISEPAAVNLDLGWKLIDKYVTTAGSSEGRHESPRFVLAWQSEDPPEGPGFSPGTKQERSVMADVDDDADNEYC